MRFHEHMGAARAALFLGGLLLLWWAMADIAEWWRLVEPPAEPPMEPQAARSTATPLFAVCANGRMALRTAPTDESADGWAACQPFTSRLIAINRAEVAALTALPGIGLVTAGKIVAYREHHGHFRSVADLARVPGIGVVKAARFAEYLSFE